MKGHGKNPLQTFQEVWEWLLEAEIGKAQSDRPAERDAPGKTLNFPLQRELIIGHKALLQARCVPARYAAEDLGAAGTLMGLGSPTS